MPARYTEDDLLPLAGAMHVLFCQRRAALSYLEGQWEDNVFTVEGALRHERAHEGPTREARGDLLIVRGLRVRSFDLGLTGICDVVEFQRTDGVGVELPRYSGRWMPYPVEYKRGRRKENPFHRVQLCAQAMCLEEMLGIAVPLGALYYGMSARREEVALGDDVREETRRAAELFHRIMREGVTPPPEFGSKCDGCSLQDLCMPRTARTRSAAGYLDAAMAPEGSDPR